MENAYTRIGADIEEHPDKPPEPVNERFLELRAIVKPWAGIFVLRIGQVPLSVSLNPDDVLLVSAKSLQNLHSGRSDTLMMDVYSQLRGNDSTRAIITKLRRPGAEHSRQSAPPTPLLYPRRSGRCTQKVQALPLPNRRACRPPGGP